MQFQYRADQDRANEMVRRLGLVAKTEVEWRNCLFTAKTVSGEFHYDSKLGLAIVKVTAHTPLATPQILSRYFDKLFA